MAVFITKSKGIDIDLLTYYHLIIRRQQVLIINPAEEIDLLLCGFQPYFILAYEVKGTKNSRS